MKTNLSGLSKSVQLGRGGFLTSPTSSKVIVSTDGSAENKGIISAKSAEFESLELPSIYLSSENNTSYAGFEADKGVSVLNSLVDMANKSYENPVNSISLSLSGLDPLLVRELLIWTDGEGRVYLPVQGTTWSEILNRVTSKISETELNERISITLSGDNLTISSLDSSAILYQVLLSKGFFGTFQGNGHTGQIENSLGQGFLNNSYVSNVILSIEDLPVTCTISEAGQVGATLDFSVEGYFLAYANGRKQSSLKTSRLDPNGQTVESGSGLNNLSVYCENCSKSITTASLIQNLVHDVWLKYDSSTETFDIVCHPQNVYYYGGQALSTSAYMWYDSQSNYMKQYVSNDWQTIYAVRIGEVSVADNNLINFKPYYPFQISQNIDTNFEHMTNYISFLGTTSGVKYLETNKVYSLQTNGNVIFSLADVGNNAIHNQIKVFLNRAGNHTISLGTTHYITGEAPDLSETGNYILYYDYFPNLGWCVGGMKVS